MLLVNTRNPALHRYRVLNAPAPPAAAAVPAADIPQLQERLLGLADAGLTADEYFCGWFRGAPPEAIRRGNVEDFVAYGFHCRPLQDLSQEARPLRVPLSSEVHRRDGDTVFNTLVLRRAAGGHPPRQCGGLCCLRLPLPPAARPEPAGAACWNCVSLASRGYLVGLGHSTSGI